MNRIIWYFVGVASAFAIQYLNQIFYYNGLYIHKRPEQLPAEYCGIFSRGELCALFFNSFTLPLVFLSDPFLVKILNDTDGWVAVFWIVMMLIFAHLIQRKIDQVYYQ